LTATVLDRRAGIARDCAKTMSRISRPAALGRRRVLTAEKSLPAGIYAAACYLTTFPDTPANAAWGEAYRERFNQYPINWSWQNATGWMFAEAAAKQAGGLDAKKMSEVLTGMTIDCPFGVDGKMAMRDDHTLVNHAAGWGKRIPRLPYVVDISPADWKRIFRAWGRLEEAGGLHLTARAWVASAREGFLSPGSECSWRLRDDGLVLGHADDQRLARRPVAVPGGGAACWTSPVKGWPRSSSP
jgi:hypothetical protein